MSKCRVTVILSLITVMATLFGYARLVEPVWIEVTRHRISADVDRPIKIIQLSDLHTYEFGEREERVLSEVQREKPDVIVISGDAVANKGDWRSVGILLSRLRAPLGVFLVRGNWEHWRPDPSELKIYEDSGVTFLNNDSQSLSKKTWVVGMDDALAGTPDVKGAFAKVPSGVFRIVLFHSPAYFDLIDQRVDLGLSGHTHGGQLRIPFIPPLWLPEGSGDYVEGWYSRGRNRMYVSRGIGNSILELRFACRPEISVFELEPSK